MIELTNIRRQIVPQRQKDLFEILRREVLVGRLRVMRDEERVERFGVNERRERR